MLVFSQRLRPRAGLGARSDIETTAIIDFLWLHQASGRTLSAYQRGGDFWGNGSHAFPLRRSCSPMLWELWAAYDQFMSLCISTCFGLKMTPGENVQYIMFTGYSGAIRSANFCAHWGVPAFERKFLFSSSRAKFIACGFREVPFWDGAYGSLRTQDSVSRLPSVARICLSDCLWKERRCCRNRTEKVRTCF